MTRVKICGITNKEDARAAVDYGADALGFVLIQESPRFIDLMAASEIMYDLPPFTQTVGLLNICKDDAEDIFHYGDMFHRASGLLAIQFYSGNCSRIVNSVPAFIRAFRMRDESSLVEIETYLKRPPPDTIAATFENLPPDAILLDTYHKDKLGGSGETFNWDLAVEAKRRFDVPIILAGGLTADNVTEAIAKVQPYAVDVSSGVEAEPGRKDHAKMKAFIRAVRRADL